MTDFSFWNTAERFGHQSASYLVLLLCLYKIFAEQWKKANWATKLPGGWHFLEIPTPAHPAKTLSLPILAPGHVVCGVCASYTPSYWIFAIVKNIDKQKRVVCLSVERGKAFAWAFSRKKCMAFCALPAERWAFVCRAWVPISSSVFCLFWYLHFCFFVRSNLVNIWVCFAKFFNIVGRCWRNNFGWRVEAFSCCR